MRRPLVLLVIGGCVWGATLVGALVRRPQAQPAPMNTFPEGPGRDVAVRLCTDCHAVVDVTKHRESRARWGQIIDKMIDEGAQINDADFERLVIYFSVALGKKVKINAASATVISETFDIDEELAATIVKHRSQKGAFKTWKDIAAVPGINPARVEEQKDNLDFSVSLGPGLPELVPASSDAV